MPNPQPGTTEGNPQQYAEETSESGDPTAQLIQAADHLAAQHQEITLAAFPPYLLQRLSRQSDTLQVVHQFFLQTSEEESVVTTAAEWILDNYYIVERAVQEIEKDLPESYYKQLPKLTEKTEYYGYPRVYAIARAYTSDEDCHIDLNRLETFVLAYQGTTPLTMGELWALPIMLRFCLLECLLQTIVRISHYPGDESLASALRLLVKAPDNTIIANSILGLRLLDSSDWEAFFEDVSLVDQALRQEPGGLYGRMTFNTRDQYRKVVESLAQSTRLTELEVAQTAVQLAETALATSNPGGKPPHTIFSLSPDAHVGYYLLGPEQEQLEREIGYRPPRLKRWLKQHTTGIYMGGITLVTLLLVVLLAVYASLAGGGWWQVLLAAVFGLVPASAVVIGLTNWLITIFVKPHILPKLDFSDGLPASCRTMIVMPTMLTSEKEIDSLISQLEQHYLRNPDPNFGYALLTDFADAPEQNMPEDEALVAHVKKGIEALNERYSNHPFYVFHRHRLYNPSEGAWMGWERKRGKLHEFNRLLRQAKDTSFSVKVGDLSFLPAVKYIITLDADTLLPVDAACRLVGTLAHPLNRAICDPETGKVTEGYTILQPRTEIKPDSVGQSWFTRIFSGDVGLDLYTLAVSDVYQDLFNEGIYVGKGIYDVDAFEWSLKDLIPENTLLSHDLFEGVQGRVALVTDIVLYEDYPPHYLVHVRRSHRWVRGDWQLLPWLLPGRTNLSPLSFWKIADNLRRSLVAPAVFLFFVGSWLWLPGPPLIWTLIVLVATAIPLITSVATAVRRGLGDAPWRDVRRPVGDSAVRWLLQIAFLPYEALLNLDAILITLWRLFVTRRNLLEWTTAAHTTRLLGENVTAEKTAGQMARSLILVLIILLFLVIFRPEAVLAAAPLILIWGLSTEIAYRISRPRIFRPVPLTGVERQRLRTLARRTWLFFEEFVGPEDNWLPPDHFQESPRGVVAHRTSPTNIGLYLLSTLAAYDMGYISLLNLSLRLTNTFDTLDKLDRYRGHFLNWLNTQTLHPLNPSYISTVDSGNLAGCLLALKQGCLSAKNDLVVRPQRWKGLADTLSLFTEAIAVLPSSKAVLAIRDQLSRLERLINESQDDPESWVSSLGQLTKAMLPELDQRLLALFEDEASQFPAEMVHQWRVYTDRLWVNVEGIQRELELLSPWLFALQDALPYFSDPNASPDVQKAWAALKNSFQITPRLDEIVEMVETAGACLQDLRVAVLSEDNTPERGEAGQWCIELQGQLAVTKQTAEFLLSKFENLVYHAGQFVSEMDFTFLYNPQRNVFHIGYNLESGRLDPSYYDLLASEARIASLIAIAKRDVPLKHWLHLSRPLTRIEGGLVLLSWSGTMFEYLMPPLLMNSYRGTLLAQSCEVVLEYQMNYGEENQIPWGISESGFYNLDNAQNYQYRAFGVPGVGFKRGLSDDLVVAPYASLMALPMNPKAVLDNIDHLLRWRMMGLYGFYEAIDFTSSRMPLGQEAAVIYSYMSHHQGMIMLGLVNYLEDEIMVGRFHSEPSIQSVELLLQEQVPQGVSLQNPHEDEAFPRPQVELTGISATSWPVPAETPVPMVHFLSNGRLSCLITNAGGGYLSTADIALTRWRPDTTQDNWGLWLYVKDIESGEIWSAGSQPSGRLTQEQHFYPHMARFRRHDYGITIQLDISIAADADVEVRLLHLANNTPDPRRLRLASYSEVVLGDFAADNRHPAFSKLFVESEYLPEHNALFFRRRPRSDEDSPRFMGHMLIVSDGITPTKAFESDRAEFLGRSGTQVYPAALRREEDQIAGTTGATLDPIMSLGQIVELDPHTEIEMAWITFVGDSRAHLVSLAQEYGRWVSIRRIFSGAKTQAEKELTHLRMPVSDVAQAQRLLSLLMYPHKAIRAGPDTLGANLKGQSGLWAYDISGDFPILLLRIDNEKESKELLAKVLQAHAYWRRRDLRLDLVILNSQATNYGQPVQQYILRSIERSESEHWLNRRGGIFILRGDQMTQEDRILLETTARVILDGSRGTLETQLSTLMERPTTLPAFVPVDPPAEKNTVTPPVVRPDNLLFDNGFGGFAKDGREYVVYLKPGETTPAPWINVIANDAFGFLVSETGGGYSWAGNSGENRLTTWRNDPVSDVPAEALFLRDEETAEIWSATPQPSSAEAPYLIRHGAGYTIFEHNSHGLQQQLRLFAAPNAPVKIVQLRLKNLAKRPRRLTATYYAEWVLGADRNITQAFIIPGYHSEHQALTARNPYNMDFGQAVAFLAADREPHGFTADRAEFIGRLGNLNRPAALERIGLTNAVPVGADPCAAIQLHIDLKPGGSEELYFLLGQGRDEAEALALIEQFQNKENVSEAWKEVQQLWESILGTVTVETPDPAMNLMLNRWLLYQALSCRIWGRSALYQSSGAYGFRDQLQDVMSLVHARPDLAREHLLRSARHQFEEGDVLHWWHPPNGRGVRTRITDDLAWLPFVTAHYIEATGDAAVLDETIPFLKASPLARNEEERYGLYAATETKASLYEHCIRALEKAATTGRHGLPLMGAGDWNDGMNRVGIEGEGESVWLGWFLAGTLKMFSDVCRQQGDQETADRFQRQAEAYREAIEKNAWDGGWYRRAYYDDGTPLGSRQNKECRLDAIAQSWAVLTGLGEHERVRQAMSAVIEHLVHEKERLLLLFTPPFDKTRKDPGYIKGYLPGIRENGGQYTHAALWTIWAFAELGEGERAEALFRLINPVYRADSKEKAGIYKVEPYVISADVYGVPPHQGRGGWTWYTGSGAWMYRLGLEGILGLRRQGNAIKIQPRIPPDWPEFKVVYRFGRTYYHITVKNNNEEERQIWLDGKKLLTNLIPLDDDGREHVVEVV